MNKQELIDKYEYELKLFRLKFGEIFKVKVYEELLDYLKQLDEPEPNEEPQKVTVPQFVADYIEFKKENDFHVYGAMRVIEDHYDKRVPEWFYEKNIELFARAWLNGYTVEKEKRYTVKIKGELEENLLVYGLGVKKYFFTRFYDSSKKGKHTRKELEEAGFSEVFNSPLFEVEEVE